MENFRKLAVFASLVTIVTLAQASPVQFEITSASITPGSGYGIDSGQNPENGGSLLDVRFTNAFTTQSFLLSSIGQEFSFTLGTVNFAEPDFGSGGNLGIRNQELDSLGVTATFTFTNPLGIISSLSAQGTATLGSVADAAVDYTLTWAPLLTDFGSGGLFEISLNDLVFSNIGTMTETATVKLLALPGEGQIQQAAAVIPEPASMALVTLGLLGIGFSRRRMTAGTKSACPAG